MTRTRTRIYLAWLAATALLVTGFFLATARHSYPRLLEGT